MYIKKPLCACVFLLDGLGTQGTFWWQFLLLSSEVSLGGGRSHYHSGLHVLTPGLPGPHAWGGSDTSSIHFYRCPRGLPLSGGQDLHAGGAAARLLHVWSDTAACWRYVRRAARPRMVISTRLPGTRPCCNAHL